MACRALFAGVRYVRLAAPAAECACACTLARELVDGLVVDDESFFNHLSGLIIVDDIKILLRLVS